MKSYTATGLHVQQAVELHKEGCADTGKSAEVCLNHAYTAEEVAEPSFALLSFFQRLSQQAAVHLRMCKEAFAEFADCSGLLPKRAADPNSP